MPASAGWTLLRPAPLIVLVGLGLAIGGRPTLAAEGPEAWRREFPNTAFEVHAVDLDEIRSDGARRDSIPPIDEPALVPVAKASDIGPLEPVIGIEIDGDRRAYPLRVLLWHQIVNDEVGGVPVLVTYCPLCNAAVVFERRLDGRTLSFGNTGRTRRFDMIMYDRMTESWWQQFTGEAIVGELTGARLDRLPARLESLERFAARGPEGRVLVPNDPRERPYGTTPYVGTDTRIVARDHFPYGLPEDVRPLERVVAVGDEAWTLDLLRASGRIERGDLVITWTPGQNSVHDAPRITNGRDVGNVVVQRRSAHDVEDVPYDVVFAFAFAAFRPEGTLHYR